MVLILSSCKFETAVENNPSSQEEEVEKAIKTSTTDEEKPLWQPYDDSREVAANAQHEKEKMRFKFIQSKVLDKNEVFEPLHNEVSQFSLEQYQSMRPLILEPATPMVSSFQWTWWLMAAALWFRPQQRQQCRRPTLWMDLQSPQRWP